MKKILLAVIVISCFATSSALASNCNIPEFIKKGITISWNTGSWGGESQVIEIDEKSCWVKTNDEEYPWLNLNSIAFAKVVEK